MAVIDGWKNEVTITIKEARPARYDEPDLAPCHDTVITFDAADYTIHNWYKIFERILILQGFSEDNIASGGCQLAFNEFRSKDLMKKLYNEYELSEFHEDAPSV